LENSEQVASEIREVVDEISKIGGVIAVILFGSYSRGELDEGSDIDLLVVFDDNESYMEGSPQMSEATAKRDIFIQAVSMTLDELKRSRLLSAVLAEGRNLYTAQSFNLFSLAEDLLKPYALITYDLRHLSPRRKVKFIHAIQGRGKGRYTYPGLLHKLNGFKVGRNTIMVPIEKMSRIIERFNLIKADYVIRYVWSTPINIEARREKVEEILKRSTAI